MSRARSLPTKRSAVAAAFLCSAGTGSAAERPEDVLPDAMYATGKGCTVIKKTLPEEVERFTFMALYNTTD